MIPFRLVLFTLSLVAAVSIAAWLRHDATERERGRAAAERAETLTRTEEARREADTAADRAGAADELRRHWNRPE